MFQFQNSEADAENLLNLLKDSYKNLNFESRDIVEDSKGTSVEELISSGYIDKERDSRTAHISRDLNIKLKAFDYSNIMRSVYLLKYGGIHADLDIFALTQIPDYLPQNFFSMTHAEIDYIVSG